MSIAAPVFLRRRGALTPFSVAVSVLATATIGYVFYKNLVPVPPSPYDTFPYIFLAWILIGLGWYLVLKARDPERAAQLGTFQDQEGADLEARIAAEVTTGTKGAGRA